MRSKWTKEDIYSILTQLNKRNLPFRKYEISMDDKDAHILGEGGASYVYMANRRGQKEKKEYAIKVIGFGNAHVDSKSFRQIVNTQMELSKAADANVVRIYGVQELRIWIKNEHEVVKTEVIRPEETDIPEGNFIHLQFVVMERIEPILTIHKNGTSKVIPTNLANYDEREIMKVVYDIGGALEQAHNRKIIHRDVKLENILYSYKSKCYKLCDFGIAKRTNNGEASTLAYTDGYGAPEVIKITDNKEKYDYTVDVYSLGMVAYVLLNRLKFPSSDSYRPERIQYSNEYEAPRPKWGSDRVCTFVLKMISYYPDDRYQTMKQVLDEAEQIILGDDVFYKREHKSLTYVMGALLTLSGMLLWKLSFMPEFNVELSIWMYVLFFLCIGRCIAIIMQKKKSALTVGILFVSIFILFSTGFTWIKMILLLLLCLVDAGSGVFALGVILLKMSSLVFQDIHQPMMNLRWLTVLLVIFAIALLFQIELLEYRDIDILHDYFKSRILDKVLVVLFLLMILYSFYVNESNSLLVSFIGWDGVGLIKSCNLKLIGVTGFFVCIFWMVREKVMLKKELERYD